MREPFDLKYRPRRFADVIGNKAVVRLLLKLSSEGRLTDRSFMFGGPKGCGKTTLARIVARAIVCDSLQAGEPCSECPSCLSIITESADSFEEFDAATQGTVDRMRSIVQSLDYGNLSGRPLVVVLDEAQRLSKQGQDALLKSIEDRRLIVIFCTTEPHKIQGAIRNRVTEFPISEPPESESIELMEKVCKLESVSYDAAALQLIAKLTGSCPRSCMTSIDLMAPTVTVESVRSFFRHSGMESVASVLGRIDSNPVEALRELDTLMSAEGATWVRDTIVQAISSEMRVSVGARPTFPVPCRFFESRGRRWADLAHILGSMEKPTATGVDVALLTACPILMTAPGPVQSAPAPPVHVPAPVPAPAPAPASSVHASALAPAPAPPVHVPAPAPPAPLSPISIPPPSKVVEVDGVKYTREESLTSLDSKIDRDPKRHASSSPRETAEVGLNLSMAPISEKEFARGFVQRFKKAE